MLSDGSNNIERVPPRNLLIMYHLRLFSVLYLVSPIITKRDNGIWQLDFCGLLQFLLRMYYSVGIQNDGMHIVR